MPPKRQVPFGLLYKYPAPDRHSQLMPFVSLRQLTVQSKRCRWLCTNEAHRRNYTKLVLGIFSFLDHRVGKYSHTGRNYIYMSLLALLDIIMTSD